MLARTLDPSLLARPGLAAGPARVADANVAVAELEVLRLDLDLVSRPGEVDGADAAGALGESLVERFRATPSSGDQLRLPPPAHFTAAQIRRALDRFMSARPAPSVFEEAVVKEAQLRRLIGALVGAQRHIAEQQRAAV